MPQAYLLPLYYIRSANKKLKYKFYNEKYLILLLLLVSIVTVFIILLNLPSDIQKVVNKDKLQNVFIPELNNEPKLALRQQHNQDHQHPAPPIFNDKNKHPFVKSENNQKEHEHVIEKPPDNRNNDDITAKREKIKQVKSLKENK